MNPTSVPPKPYQRPCGLIYFPGCASSSLRSSIIFALVFLDLLLLEFPFGYTAEIRCVVTSVCQTFRHHPPHRSPWRTMHSDGNRNDESRRIREIDAVHSFRGPCAFTSTRCECRSRSREYFRMLERCHSYRGTCPKFPILVAKHPREHGVISATGFDIDNLIFSWKNHTGERITLNVHLRTVQLCFEETPRHNHK